MIRGLLRGIKEFFNKVHIGQLRAGCITALAFSGSEELLRNYEERLIKADPEEIGLAISHNQQNIQGGQ